MLIWLNDRSAAAESFAKNFLLNHSGSGNDINRNPKGAAGQILSAPVKTTQIAPTILQLLGLDPNALQAVQIEHTAALPVG